MASKLGPTPEFRFNDDPDDKFGVEFKFEGDDFQFYPPETTETIAA